MIDLSTSSNPPLLHTYAHLLHSTRTPITPLSSLQDNKDDDAVPVNAPPLECQLPLIDLSGLDSECEVERRRCADAICRASSEWGFFQVVNHGISSELLTRMRREQVKLFETPFEKKIGCGLLNNSYRWGNPAATRPDQFSWSEAFHVPLTKVSDASCYGDFTSLREVMVELAAAMAKLARTLAGILAENVGRPKGALFEEMCDERSCFLRLNRYPACPAPASRDAYGLVPHTDSDFLTILYQDHVGGLQLLKDSRWVAVKPNRDALIVNIGDLLQAWSNDVYKSVEHKVMGNEKEERYSIAYFLCPSYDALIGSCKEPSVYRKFTFGEYRHQVQRDVKTIGHKVGLPRFRL